MTDRLQEIFDEWEKEDADEAAEGLASDKDAMDLAEPSTWADTDQPAQGASRIAGEGAETLRIKPPPMAPEESSQPVLASKPTTAGVGQNAAPESPHGKPAALPPVEGLDWKQLADRLAMAEAGRAQSKGYESLFANVGAQSGYRPNAAAGDVLTATAKQPLDLAKERQGMESRDLSNRSQRQALGVKAAMDDPNSLQSQKAREAVRTFFEGQKLPSGFDNWSASDVKTFADSGDLAKLGAQRAAGEERARKAQGDADKAAKTEADLQQMRKTWAPELKRAGKDPTTASKFDVEQVMALERAREGRSTTINQSNAKEQRDSVEKLAKLLPPDYRDFQRKVDEIEQIAASGKGDIPGVGLVDANTPRWLQSDSGIELQKRAKQLSLAYQHLITGAGASDKERASLEQATVDLQDERSFMSGLRTLKGLYENKVRQIRAGFPEDVVSQYDSNIDREFSGSKPSSPVPAPSKPPQGLPPDAVFDDGAWWYEENGKMMRHMEAK